MDVYSEIDILKNLHDRGVMSLKEVETALTILESYERLIQDCKNKKRLKDIEKDFGIILRIED